MNRIYQGIIVVIIAFSFVNTLGMLGLAVIKGVHGYSMLLTGESEKPAVEIVESLDRLLIVLLLLIMNIGLLKLFLPDSKLAKSVTLPWLKVNTFADLKILLIETILTTLVVVFVTTVVKKDGRLEWIDIIIPVAVLFFSLTIKFFKGKDH